ncbi:hypothetical protein PINS_up013527 [Pythium insidiosum]|nr:hypothetical protein PINS_up013527 [Pythium insidiosum]
MAQRLAQAHSSFSSRPKQRQERAMRADIDIRHATIDDAQALHELGVRTFVEAFGHAWKPEAMHEFLSASYSVEAIRTSLKDPNTLILMAFHRGNDAPAGFAVLLYGKPRPDLNPGEVAVSSESHTELEKFYVDKPFHGKGVAQALMDQVLRETRQRDCETKQRCRRVVWLRVWESNPRAIQFYRNRGFQECGDVEIFDGFRDLVFEYPLDNGQGIAATC